MLGPTNSERSKTRPAMPKRPLWRPAGDARSADNLLLKIRIPGIVVLVRPQILPSLSVDIRPGAGRAGATRRPGENVFFAAGRSLTR